MYFGAGNEIRTRDLNLGKVALYQLSYSRKIPFKLYNGILELPRCQCENTVFKNKKKMFI
jgi:hypothetical protein